MKADSKNRGFSLNEIKEAGLNIAEVKKAGLKYDKRRKTSREDNVKLLQTLVKRSKASKDGKKKVDPEKLAVKSLDEVDGLSSKLKQKLMDLGVESPADFVSEDDDDLVVFLGVDAKQVKEWKKIIQG